MSEESKAEKVKKPRGRPKKVKTDDSNTADVIKEPVKRKRGRPSKKDLEERKAGKDGSEPREGSTKSFAIDGLPVTIKDATSIKRKYESFRKRFDLADD